MCFFLQYVFKLTILKTTFLLDSALVCSPVFDEATGNTSVVGRKDKLGATVSLDSSQSLLDPSLKASLLHHSCFLQSKKEMRILEGSMCKLEQGCFLGGGMERRTLPCAK